MSGYSEDLRRRIVSSVEGGMLKAQAARTFSVSLSSVKRYVNKAQRGEPLTPKKRPGSTPKLDEKAMKLLQDDLTERPFATLRERCEYVGFTTGLWVSRSTMCRAIARIGPTRKKGGGIGGGDRDGALGDQRPRRPGLLRACRIPPCGSPTVKRAVISRVRNHDPEGIAGRIGEGFVSQAKSRYVSPTATSSTPMSRVPGCEAGRLQGDSL